MGEKFYITTPIYYVNDRPHVGHAYVTIAADVLARFWRIRLGEDRVWFLTGTDEHGAKIEQAAKKAGKTPHALADEVSESFRGAWEELRISYNDFIRTTEPRHAQAVVSFLKVLQNAKTPAGNSALYEGEYRGLYCTGHEAFIKESDLADGLCPDHKTKPELVAEKNWFFRLSNYAEVLRARIMAGELVIDPESRRNETLSFIAHGLEDIAISRPQVQWGIPLPFDSVQTTYVWVDALINYISAIGYGSDEAVMQRWWPADLHLVGKDIIKFHCVIWPALLLAAGLALPRKIFAHGFFTVDGEKISKSLGNAIDPMLIAKAYGVDALRYYLLREIPFGEDGDFSEEKLKAVYTGELSNGLGNLVARVAALGEKVSPLRFDFARDIRPAVHEEIDTRFRRYEEAMDSLRLHEALGEVWRLIGFTDRYLSDTKPWAVADPEELRKIISRAAWLVSTVVNLVRPFLPETADKIQEQIRFADGVIEMKKGAGLFPRLG